MKKLSRSACNGLLILATLLSAASAEAACHVTSHGGRIDYGELNRHLIPGSAEKLSLTARDVQIAIDCDAPQIISVRFASAQGAEAAFAFGQQGEMQLRLHDARLDSRAASFNFLPSGGSPESAQPLSEVFAEPESRIVMREPGQHLRFTLSLLPRFAPGFSSVRDRTSLLTQIRLEVSEGT
ncbi:hypothetical protein V8O11_04485 [Erwinia aphidicola]|uniref:hypothetical protein n=1 Tax=Erwinia aphidicola TaxID=68334 RepID=UPI00300D5E50